MEVNQLYYSRVYDAVFRKKAEPFFRQQYHLLTNDHDERNYEPWVNKWIENYQMYRSRRFDDYDSIANSMMDCLEDLINNGKG